MIGKSLNKHIVAVRPTTGSDRKSTRMSRFVSIKLYVHLKSFQSPIKKLGSIALLDIYRFSDFNYENKMSME